MKRDGIGRGAFPLTVPVNLVMLIESRKERGGTVGEVRRRIAV